MLLHWNTQVKAQESFEANEYELMALFTYNFTQYISWPGAAQRAEFNIVILGDSEMEEPLRKVAESKKVGKKPIVVKQIDDISELNDGCHILVIGDKKRSDIRDAIEVTKTKNMLLIGADRGLAALGADINFVLLGGKIRFEINPKSLERHGLKMRSQLMKLGIIIEE